MIPMYKPLIEDEEINAAKEALEMGWLGMGSYVAAFEEGIKEYTQAADRYVAVVSTGHAALHLGLLIAGVGPGDEVITPSFNNIADQQAILATGAEPVFCDISDTTLCIDLEKAEELISERTKALIAMDYGCMFCDHHRVDDFAEAHGIRVVHDAAHAFGSKYNGKMIGSFSDICMFSFDPVKNITCIDGGALIVRSEEELRKLHEMRLIGMGQPASVMYQNKRAWTYDVNRVGYRYHMANLHAAIGLAQLAKIETITETKQHAARYFNQHLSSIDEIKIPQTDFVDTTPFLYYVRVPAERRDAFREHLRNRDVETGIHWQPSHWFTMFKDRRRGDLSVTDRVGNEIVSIPLHSHMPEENLERITEAITSFFTPNGK